MNLLLFFSLSDELTQYLGEQYGLWASQCYSWTRYSHGGNCSS